MSQEDYHNLHSMRIKLHSSMKALKEVQFQTFTRLFYKGDVDESQDPNDILSPDVPSLVASNMAIERRQVAYQQFQATIANVLSMSPPLCYLFKPFYLKAANSPLSFAYYPIISPTNSHIPEVDSSNEEDRDDEPTVQSVTSRSKGRRWSYEV